MIFNSLTDHFLETELEAVYKTRLNITLQSQSKTDFDGCIEI